MKHFILALFAMLVSLSALAQEVYVKKTNTKAYYRIKYESGKEVYAMLRASEEPTIKKLKNFDVRISEKKYIEVMEDEAPLIFGISKTNGVSDAFFDVHRWESDYATLLLANDYGNDKRAKYISEMNKMNKDGGIEWQYVISPMNKEDTINVAQFMSTIQRWQSAAFKSDRVVKETTANSITYEWNAPNVAFVTGYMSATAIGVSPRAKIEVKPERFRVTVTVQHYSMGSANLNGPSSELYVVGNMYPFKNSKHKASCTQAYINSNIQATTMLSGLFEYLNKNYLNESDKKEEDDNW